MGALFSVLLCAAPVGWPALSPPASEPGGGQGDAAVVVAIEDYGSVPDVPGAQANGDDWYQQLVRGRKVPAEHVWLLKNNEGTVERMRKYLALAAGAVKPGGTVWFVFIGHGAPATDGKDGLLVGFDAQADAESLSARGLPKREALAVLSQGKQARTVVVLDACFSGRTSTGQELVKGFQPLVALHEGGKLPERAIVFTAAQADQFAGPLPGARRPAFSYLVLGALRGWGDEDHDGNVTATEAWQYARKGLQTLVRDRTQFPGLDGVDDGAPLTTQAREREPNLAALALLREAKGTEPLAPPPRSGGNAVADTTTVDVLGSEEPLEWTVRFERRGEKYPCAGVVTKEAPCRLTLPVGPGRFELVGGTHRFSTEWLVTPEYTTVRLSTRPKGMIGVWVAVLIVGVGGLAASINELATNGGRSSWGGIGLGLSIAPALLGVLGTVGTLTAPGATLDRVK